MKILARSVLMLLALGFATFGNLFDSPNVNTVNWAIAAEDSDDDQDDTKRGSHSVYDVVLFSAPHLGSAASLQILLRLLDTPSTALYKLLSVYRL